MPPRWPAKETGEEAKRAPGLGAASSRTGRRSARRPRAGSPAMPPSYRCSKDLTAPSTSGAARARSRPRSDGPCGAATAAAGSRVAPTTGGRTGTTSNTGEMAERRASTTSCCSADTTTDSYTKRGSRSSADATAPSSFAAPTGTACPTHHGCGRATKVRAPPGLDTATWPRRRHRARSRSEPGRRWTSTWPLRASRIGRVRGNPLSQVMGIRGATLRIGDCPTYGQACPT